jgi:phosphate transport system protein
VAWVRARLMRTAYREELDQVLVGLVDMNGAVAAAVHQATQALLGADLHLAERVISSDQRIDDARTDLEAHAFMLLARQAPVAGELRTVVATLRMVAELERMGDLAVHIARVARMRYPEYAVPQALRFNFDRTAILAEEMVVNAGQTLQDRNVTLAERLVDQDHEMNDLRATQFRTVLGKDWSYGIEAAVDVALLGRYYERIADHAATMARRVIYLVTGRPAGHAVRD